jgi:hypothetical protein
MQEFTPRRRQPKIVQQISRLDFFPKPVEDVKQKASTGAIVSILGFILMAILFFSELSEFVVPGTQDTILVDTSRAKTMTVNFDLVFFALPCKDVNVDTVDNEGASQTEIKKDIQKQDVDAERFLQRNLFSLFGIRDNYVPYGKGCRVSGKVEVNRVKGNLHIAAGHSQVQSHAAHAHHVHQVNAADLSAFNASHYITHFSFGPDFPRRTHPLSWFKASEYGVKQVNYLIQVVPTVYQYYNGETVEGYQYSAQMTTKKLLPGSTAVPLPGVFFKWDISPFVIKYQEGGRSLAHFFTRVCAIIGGAFVVLGLLYRAGVRAYFAIKPDKKQVL